MKRKLLPLIIVLFGIGNMMLLIATGPSLEPQPIKSVFPLVRVVEVVSERVQITSKTYGTVKPRTEGELIPEVGRQSHGCICCDGVRWFLQKR